MIKSVTDEYRYVPREHSRPAPEWHRPADAESFFKTKRRDKSSEAEVSLTEDTSKKRRERMKQKLKLYALSTATAVTVAVGLSAGNSRWDMNRLEQLLWERPLAYYAESAEQLEYYAENELWYTIFGADAQGNEREFYGMYGKSLNGPTKEFRDALTVEPDENKIVDILLGLPSYSFSLVLNDGSGAEEKLFSSDIILLENERQTVAAWMENGEVHEMLIEDDGNPEGAARPIVVESNYDIDYDEHGEHAERVWVFGNGTDIVGVWESDPQRGRILVHATAEHSNDATGKGPAYLIEFTHEPHAADEILPEPPAPQPQPPQPPQPQIRGTEFNGVWNIVSVEEHVVDQQTMDVYDEPIWNCNIEAGLAPDGAPILTMHCFRDGIEEEYIFTGNGDGEYKAHLDNGDFMAVELHDEELTLYREISDERVWNGRPEQVRRFIWERYIRA